MRLIGNIAAFIAALAVLGLVIWAGFIGVRFLVIQFGMIDAREMPVLVIASVVYLAGAGLVAGAIRSYLQRHDKQIHPEKAVLYSEIITFWQTYNGEKNQVIEKISEWLPNMQLWASDDVLKEFLLLCESLRKDNTSQELLKKGFGKLIMEIRKDMGHRNRGLNSNYFDVQRP